MKGMLLKDILNIRGQIAYYAVIIAVFFAVAAVTGNLYFYAGISCFCGVAVPLSAVAYDEKDNWERFALAAGVTRGRLALSRYLLGLASFFPVWGLSFLLFVLPSFRTAENLLAVLTFGGMGLLVMSVVLPLVFKMGTEKARAVYIVVILAVMLCSAGLASFFGLAEGAVPVVAAVLLAAGIVSVPISFAVSCSVYRKKDF